MEHFNNDNFTVFDQADFPMLNLAAELLIERGFDQHEAAHRINQNYYENPTLEDLIK